MLVGLSTGRAARQVVDSCGPCAEQARQACRESARRSQADARQKIFMPTDHRRPEGRGGVLPWSEASQACSMIRARMMAALGVWLTMGAEVAGADTSSTTDPNRSEIAGLPVVAYNSDLGLALGALFVLAQFDPDTAPYRWRLELLLSTTLKQEPDGSYALPYHDDYVKLDRPGLLDDHLRVGAELHFGRYADSAWYGIGDGSSSTPPSGGGDRYFTYGRTY